MDMTLNKLPDTIYVSPLKETLHISEALGVLRHAALKNNDISCLTITELTDALEKYYNWYLKTLDMHNDMVRESVMKPILTYIAIPYTGMEDKSFEMSNIVAGVYLKYGAVYSPISMCHPIAAACQLKTDYATWKRQNKRMLELSTAMVIVMAQGWQESEGVQWEMDLATKLNIPLIFYKPNSTVPNK